MNILLISECSKKALLETRRILDQFAERKGERTWQTAITQDGLTTLRKLLRRSARRNTAVACHWLKTSGQSELLWIVGNQRCFNEQGVVPTNSTSSDILKMQDENSWHTAEVMALLTGLAGLFHDFGKANTLFQFKLQPGSPLRCEPYRHEWISLRLFQAFVDGRDDETWISELAAVTPERDLLLRASLSRYQDKARAEGVNPFSRMPPLAQVVGWLIVSHHRLPQYVEHKHAGRGAPPLDETLQLDGTRFDASWTSPQCFLDEWTAQDWQQVWDLDLGSPMASERWCAKAREMAVRALKYAPLWRSEGNWLDDRFTLHLARLSLMLADHSYSAGPAIHKWQDLEYQAYANTERSTGQRKQKLDEHNIGVGINGVLLARRLPKLQRHLPSITRHKGFKQRSQNVAFRWQDQAFDLARAVAQRSVRQGFFGINMASTGCGKTFANARIMYGLSDEKLGCRFSIALGLRTLTLQTGDALQARLHLESDDLAVLIGSQSVQQLHELRKEEALQAQTNTRGSESADSLCDELLHVRYEGSLDDGPLRHWLKQSDKLHKLISAPVLVSTIDHLIPATEGTRGGKQIAPMLRLLTSDLVLDEPDDFDVADLPALCRLVNWAGMLGSRVLLSSATLPPALVCALFDAYQSGRQHFNRACGAPGTSGEICCAWFDEFGSEQQLLATREQFKVTHNRFVGKRIIQLDNSIGSKLRPAALLPVSTISTKAVDVVSGMAQALHQGMFQLHQEHHQLHTSGKTVSIGLIRMANINPLVAVSQYLFGMPPPADTRVHFCIYHSQHPMLVRSNMEARLDKALTRHDPEALWSLPEVQAVLQQPERHHLFVVVASAVAEVGRDHDYDWAIAEPSSMRSLIQLAGRIQRHRKQLPSTPNLLILQKNYKALAGKKPAYCRPGFESTQAYVAKAGGSAQKPFALDSHDLAQILLPPQFAFINANPRICSPEQSKASENLVTLEHRHLALRLFGSPHLLVDQFAAQWWQQDLHWCAEAQQRSRFRKSDPDECFVLYQEEEGDVPAFYRQDEQGEKHRLDQSLFRHHAFTPAERVEHWLDNDPVTQIADLAERMERDVGFISLRYTELRLRVRQPEETSPWYYDPQFGIYDNLSEN